MFRRSVRRKPHETIDEVETAVSQERFLKIYKFSSSLHVLYIYIAGKPLAPTCTFSRSSKSYDRQESKNANYIAVMIIYELSGVFTTISCHRHFQVQRKVDLRRPFPLNWYIAKAKVPISRHMTHASDQQARKKN